MTTTHTHSTPGAASNGDRSPTAGPAANLAELPTPIDVTATVPTEIDTHLGAIEAARQRQLDALPSFNRDTVMAAYRDTVERILEQVRAARDRLTAGRYGICTRCDDAISAARLELRPWVAMCTPCARSNEH